MYEFLNVLFIILMFLLFVPTETSTDLHPATLLGQRAALLIKNRLLHRQGRLQHRAREICYGKLLKKKNSLWKKIGSILQSEHKSRS